MVNDKVYVILVNFNGWHHTIECVESLLKSDYPNYQIVVVDNSSSDQSIEHIKVWADGKLNLWLSDESPLKKADFRTFEKNLAYIFYTRAEAELGGNKIIEHETEQIAVSNHGIHNILPIILIQTGKNLGFAGGNNVGIHYALNKGDGQYAWLLNNDTVVQKDTLTNLMLKMKESGKTGAVGSVLMSYSQPNRIRTLGGGVFHKYLGFTNNICSNHIFDPQLIDKVPGGTAIDFISGCSILVSNEVMNIVGLLDDEYFGYWEDADWGQRMKRQGYSLTYAPQSIVYHKEGQSSSLYAGSYFSTFNCFRFYRKYYRTLLPLVIVNRLIFIFLVAIKNNSFSYLKGSLRAYRDFLKTLL